MVLICSTHNWYHLVEHLPHQFCADSLPRQDQDAPLNHILYVTHRTEVQVDQDYISWGAYHVRFQNILNVFYIQGYVV